MKVYEYMVVYSHARGIGRIQIARGKKIGSYDDVEELDKFLQKHYNEKQPELRKVFVTDYKLLRVYNE